jgi:Ca2+-transporting ATPase
MEPPEPDVMRRRPRPPGEPVLNTRAGLLTVAVGLLVAAATAVGFSIIYRGDTANLPRARTMAFCVVSYAFIFSSFGFRSPRRTMPELGFFTNPALLGAVAVSCLLQLSVVTLPFARPVFETASHFAWEWALIALLPSRPSLSSRSSS